MPISGSTEDLEFASRQGGLVTDGDFLQRKGMPGFEPRPFAHNLPSAQIKPYVRENKFFIGSHNVTMSTNANLFLQNTYKREATSRINWDNIYGKTHGPGSTPEERERTSQPRVASLSDSVRPMRRVTTEYQPTYLEKRRKLLDLCYNSTFKLGTMPERERFTTTYGELCSEAGSLAERMDAIKGNQLSTATIKHYDVFTHKQSLDPMYGKTRFPITSTPGITEFKGPRDCNAIRMWHEFSTVNYR